MFLQLLIPQHCTALYMITWHCSWRCADCACVCVCASMHVCVCVGVLDFSKENGEGEDDAKAIVSKLAEEGGETLRAS